MTDLFFSYSHKDEEYRNELEVHLAMLKRQGLIEAWHDRRIGAGKDIYGQISAHLESAGIVLLLVSPYFLASDYCYDVEMKRALERHERGEARVIPVIIHPCDWQSAPFGHLRATPQDGKPVSKFPNVHDAFLAITTDIRDAAQELSPRSKPADGTRGPQAATPVARLPEPRSSNLRLKRPFSDRQRDTFLEDSFDFIANFFENSLEELQSRYSEVETAFRRVDANRFTAAIYINGEKQNSCRIWRGGDSMLGDIAYASGDTGPSNTYNEALSAVDDGFTLQLRPVGLRLFGNDRDSLSAQGAAEYLWSMLVGRLQ